MQVSIAPSIIAGHHSGVDEGTRLISILDSFGKLLGHSGSVSKIANKDFDPRGQYAEVLEIVEKIGDGKSTVFKVQQGHTRAEYYVVSLDGGHKRLVGLKALAVES